ncbi:hypothetical protein TNCV_2738661 [Trichonephila clavipes]|nr:hypothetical protein TNCV_2738661 [Trichonephila clavipes]
MYDPSSFANPTALAHADTSRDVLPRGGTSQNDENDTIADTSVSNLPHQAIVRTLYLNRLKVYQPRYMAVGIRTQIHDSTTPA